MASSSSSVPSQNIFHHQPILQQLLPPTGSSLILRHLDLSQQNFLQFTDVFSRFAGIQRLELKSCFEELTGNDKVQKVTQLAHLIRRHPSLTSITLHGNSIGNYDDSNGADGGNEAFAAFAAALKGCSALASFVLRYENLNDQHDMDRLASALPSLRSLKHLELTGNCILHAGTARLASTFQYLPQLTSLRLRANAAGGDENCYDYLEELANGLSCLTSLTSLDLGASYVGSELRVISRLIPGLKSLTALTSLGLHEAQLDARGFRLLVPAIQGHPSLTSLDLSDNELSDAASVSLGFLLLTASSLEELNLSRNKLGAIEISSFAYALQGRQLTTLNLSGNAIREQIDQLAGGIGSLSFLTDLNLSFNQISSMAVLAPAIGRLELLTQLNLGYNRITSEGLMLLAPELRNKSYLSGLALGDNQVDSAGVNALLSHISHLTSLSRLGLPGEHLDLANLQIRLSTGFECLKTLCLDVQDDPSATANLIALASSHPSLNNIYVPIGSATGNGLKDILQTNQYNKKILSMTLQERSIRSQRLHEWATEALNLAAPSSETPRLVRTEELMGAYVLVYRTQTGVTIKCDGVPSYELEAPASSIANTSNKRGRNE